MIPFFVSLNSPTFPDSHSGSRQGHLALLRNTILQSATSFRFTGWNRGNFRRRIATGDASKYCVAVLSIYTDQSGQIKIHLSSGESYSLSDFFADIVARGYPLAIVFLYSDVTTSAIYAALPPQAGHIIVTVACSDTRFFLFALACELGNWWGLSSVVSPVVTFDQIAACVRRLVNSYAQCIDSDTFQVCLTTDCDSSYGSPIAWSGGATYALNADVSTIRTGAREEQIADTLKRILDCAAHPRSEHATTAERLICSQGLFWLCELSTRNDITNWITATRLFAEVSPFAFKHDFGLPIVGKRAPLDAIAALEELFIAIPSNEYIFGSHDTSIESEPPAPQMKRVLKEFEILRTPVTCKLWNLFVAEPHIGALDDDVPITNVNFFQAQQFANLLTCAWRESQAGSTTLIRLPTELEWEAAARGHLGHAYPWGADFEPQRCNCEMQIGHPTPMRRFGSRGKSPFGCEDMAGNVREWTATYAGTRGVDWTMYDGEVDAALPSEIIPTSRMIIRGGSYSYSRECVQTWVRNTQVASRSDGQTGFRLVKTAS